MENNDNSENNVEKTLTPQEKLAEFEAQKMSRRQALGRFGFLAGAAAVAALSVDDLTRMAGNEMSRRAAGNKAVEQVAKELQNAGVAFADVGGACESLCERDYNAAMKNEDDLMADPNAHPSFVLGHSLRVWMIEQALNACYAGCHKKRIGPVELPSQ